MARLDAKWGNFWQRGQTWYHFWQDQTSSSGTAYVVQIDDTVTISDQASKSTVLSKVDSVTISDSSSKSIVKTSDDSVVISDLSGKSIQVSKEDQVAISDSRSSGVEVSFSDDVVISESGDIVLTPGGTDWIVNLSDTVVISDDQFESEGNSLVLNDEVLVSDDISIQLFSESVPDGTSANKPVSYDVDYKAELMNRIAAEDDDIIQIIKIFLQCQ